jgi:hypothetical protein
MLFLTHFWYLYASKKFKHTYTRLFFHKFAYSRYDILAHKVDSNQTSPEYWSTVLNPEQSFWCQLVKMPLGFSAINKNHMKFTHLCNLYLKDCSQVFVHWIFFNITSVRKFHLVPSIDEAHDVMCWIYYNSLPAQT